MRLLPTKILSHSEKVLAEGRFDRRSKHSVLGGKYLPLFV